MLSALPKDTNSHKVARSRPITSGIPAQLHVGPTLGNLASRKAIDQARMTHTREKEYHTCHWKNILVYDFSGVS